MKIPEDKYQKWREMLQAQGHDEAEIAAALDILRWHGKISNHIETYFELCGVLARAYAWTLKYLNEVQQRGILGIDKVPDSLATLTAKKKVPLVAVKKKIVEDSAGLCYDYEKGDLDLPPQKPKLKFKKLK